MRFAKFVTWALNRICLAKKSRRETHLDLDFIWKYLFRRRQVYLRCYKYILTYNEKVVIHIEGPYLITDQLHFLSQWEPSRMFSFDQLNFLSEWEWECLHLISCTFINNKMPFLASPQTLCILLRHPAEFYTDCFTRIFSSTWLLLEFDQKLPSVFINATIVDSNPRRPYLLRKYTLPVLLFPHLEPQSDSI